MTTNQIDSLLQYCENNLESMRVWSVFDWWFFNILMAISLVLSILLPFILAMILYIKDQKHQRKLQIATLIVSGIALALQILNSTLQFPNRARLSRQTYATVLLAVTDYKDGHISRQQFRERIGQVADVIVNSP